MKNNTCRVISVMIAATMMFTMAGGNIHGVNSVLAAEDGTPKNEVQKNPVEEEKVTETSADVTIDMSQGTDEEITEAIVKAIKTGNEYTAKKPFVINLQGEKTIKFNP